MQEIEIRIDGHLDTTWADWMEGFDLRHTEGGETILTGKVEDQASLYGLMGKLRDLGVKLTSIRFSPEE